MNQTKKDKENSNFKAIATLIIGCLLALFMPYVLTRKVYFQSLDFSETGQIGDTIGGIVGPLLNFTGLILVYLSFRQQFEANEIQRSGLNEQVATSNNIKQFGSGLIVLISEKESVYKKANHRIMHEH